MPRTPVPVKMVTAPVRAIRGGGRGAGKDLAVRPSAELVEIRQLRREVAVLRGDDTTEIAPDEVDLSGWLYRHRRQVAPLYVAAVLAASKVLILGPSFLPVLGLAALLVLTAGAVLWVRACSSTPWRTLMDAVPEDVRPWLGKVTSPRAAAVMAAVCSLYWWVRPTGFQEAAWAWGTGVLVAVAARAYRFRIRPTVAVAEPVMGPEGRWYAYVTENEAAAAGSRVTRTHQVISPDGDPIGITLDVEFPPGSKGAALLAATLRPRIRTAYGVGDKDVILAPDHDDDTRMAVTVLNEPGRNALDAIHEFDGRTDFDPATGIFTHGTRADWTGALIQLYDLEVGAYHGHFSGVTRAGKSEGIETLLRCVTQHGVVTPVFIDLGEVTFVDWRERAPVFVTDPIVAVILLRNIKAIGHLRQQKMGKLRRYDEHGVDIGPCRVYPISEAAPMILPVFDEWQFAIGDTTPLPAWLALEVGAKTVGDAILALTKDILTQYSKAMIGMLLAGQASGLVDGFRNCPPVRAQCQAGYMVGYRNTTESGRQVFGANISVDPSTIPLDRKGTNYLTSSADARDSRSRTRWVRTPRLFDHLVRINQLPADEMVLLTRGLALGLPPAPADDAAVRPADAPAVVVEPPLQISVEAPPSDALMDAIEFWLAEVGDWVQRKDVVSEFKDVRGMGSSTKIDAALKRLKEPRDGADSIVEAEDGKYRAKVRTTQ